MVVTLRLADGGETEPSLRVSTDADLGDLILKTIIAPLPAAPDISQHIVATRDTGDLGTILRYPSVRWLLIATPAGYRAVFDMATGWERRAEALAPCRTTPRRPPNPCERLFREMQAADAAMFASPTHAALQRQIEALERYSAHCLR